MTAFTTPIVITAALNACVLALPFHSNGTATTTTPTAAVPPSSASDVPHPWMGPATYILLYYDMFTCASFFIAWMCGTLWWLGRSRQRDARDRLRNDTMQHEMQRIGMI